jgi:hypothetical protein
MAKSINLLISLGFAAGLASFPAHSDSMTDAALGLCEKVKSCAMAQIDEQDLTPEIRQMMQPMLDGMCANMQSSVGEFSPGHPLYVPAEACMRSMETLSCDMIQDPAQVETPECQKFTAMAKEAQSDS